MTEANRPSPKTNSNGTSTAAAATAVKPAAAATPAAKPKLQHPYRPGPPPNRRRRRRRTVDLGSCCRRCFCWAILFVLALSILLFAAVAVLYLLYNPQRPAFSIASFTTANLNLSSATDQLTTSFSLSIISKNRNSRAFTFLYDPITVSLSSETSNVFLGNGTIPEFTSSPKDRTALKVALSTDSLDLDSGEVSSLRTELKDATGITAKVMMDARVRIKVGRILKSNMKVPVRVTCDGIKGVAPPARKAKSSPTVATISKSECKVDFRINIWKFTF